MLLKPENSLDTRELFECHGEYDVYQYNHGYVVDSKLPYERSIDGIPHWGYCMEAKIIGPSEKYPGCTVLQRKYALIDEELAKSIIFAYCKESLNDNDLLEDI